MILFHVNDPYIGSKVFSFSFEIAQKSEPTCTLEKDTLAMY